MKFPLRAAAATLLAGMLAACSDSPTGSNGSVSLQLTGTTSPPEHVLSNDGRPVLQCTVDLTATATGKANATALWAGSKVRFYIGPDRSAVADSASLTGGEMQQAWGASAITVGQTLMSQLVLQAGVPFAFQLEVAYAPSGGSSQRTAKYEGSCGAGAANSAAPTVTNLTVTPADGEIEPGDLLTVQYSFTAPAGLWDTSIILAGGASAAVAEQGQFETSGTRTVTVRVPGGIIAGSRAVVSVRVTDALLRQAQAGPVNGPVLADHHPPELLQVTTRTTFGNGPVNLAGAWAPGDTIHLHALATDNNRVAWMVWELGAPAGTRDSVPAEPGPVAGAADIVVLPGWAGTPQLSVWVVDAAGNRSAVLRSLPDSIRIMGTATRAVHSAVLPRGSALDAVVDPVGRRLFVASDFGSHVAVLPLASLIPGTPIGFPSPPMSIDLTPGNDSLVAALQLVRSIAWVNLASGSLSVVPVTTGDSLAGPYRVRVGADGSLVATFTRADGALVLARVNRATGALARLAAVPGGGAGRLTRTPDRSRMYLEQSLCVRELVVATGHLGDCLPLQGTRLVATDRTGSVVSNGESVFSAASGQLRTFPYEMAITGATPSLDGAELWISTVRGLVHARPDGTLLDRAAGIGPMYNGMFVIDDGATLVGVTEDGLTATVHVVDLR
ncbi:hypothetical protein [Longimicrobium sp.]|uniref:YncE family protein n=1 Tax=Longimicrobium sp. TaxID=2029185 RepID=UPI002C5C20D4|nr:hypothetical protein [Longimicrobium sp.]HSU16136.1 hypothetical protein [Longimicrobium sp.]